MAVLGKLLCDTDTFIDIGVLWRLGGVPTWQIVVCALAMCVNDGTMRRLPLGWLRDVNPEFIILPSVRYRKLMKPRQVDRCLIWLIGVDVPWLIHVKREIGWNILEAHVR